ncbi:helix-turn-helix domain-containing protein, partial [Roseivivax sp. CAU 1761]
LADQPPSPGALQRLELPLTRQAIGDHLGLTLETVSRQIGALAKTGAIKLDRAHRISIQDRDKLGELAEA